MSEQRLRCPFGICITIFLRKPKARVFFLLCRKFVVLDFLKKQRNWLKN